MVEGYPRALIYEKVLERNISDSILPLCSQVMTNLEPQQTRDETAANLRGYFHKEKDPKPPDLRAFQVLEPMVGIEPTAYSLRVNCSTPEPHWHDLVLSYCTI